MDLFLSPHFDDVVLSCPGAVLAAPRAVILTVFGDDPVRQAEDLAAAEILGAQVVHACVPEAPQRSSRHRSLGGLLASRSARLPGLAGSLHDIVRALRPARVWAPLGVGGHLDHRLVFEAARTLNAAVWLYEDRPYALLEGAVAARWRQLGHDVPLDLGAARAALAASPWVAAYRQGPLELDRVVRATLLPRRRPRRPAPTAVHHTLDAPERAVAAIQAYASQALFTAPTLASVTTERHWLLPRRAS